MDRPIDTTHATTQLQDQIFALEAKLAAATSQSYLSPIFDDMFEGIQILDFDFRYAYLNKAAANHGRRRQDELIGHSIVDMYPGIDQTEVFRLMQRCMTERVPQQMINQFTYPDVGSAWFDLRINPVPMGILVLSVDISAQKATEEHLRQSQEHLATTLSCMAEGVITTDVEGRVTRMNPTAEALTGWSEEDSKGHLFDDLVWFLNQRTDTPTEHPVAKVLRDKSKTSLTNDTVLVMRDGTHRPIASSGAPLQDASGAIYGVVLVIKDMTEEHQLTTMLHQSQKMEAIGRLAGGIAHDFNNLLTVISGYSILALQHVEHDDPLHEDLEEISKAGAHAATLIRQLLAFSRKQVLHPTVFDLNATVEQMDKMLRRLIGADIDLVTKLTPHLHAVQCDAGQIEQIIMNLAVNARDAMPHGGKLTIETANVDLDEEYVRTHPDARLGPHVMIAVTDTGTGMDANTQARIFEPFFTTKEFGKGTGLGLATVYGIVKQSGGNIWIYSELGHGTTFKIYIPQTEKTIVSTKHLATKIARHSGTETVLIVEDDDSVRALIRRILETEGYTVLETGDVDTALTLSQQHTGAIHVLLTDIVLPKRDGRTLAGQLLATRPALKVIYMSGYTDTAIVHHGVLDPGTAFIEKPITPNVLLEKIRQSLD